MAANKKSISVPLRGIIRNKPQSQSENGDCEELINLRFEDGAWRGVGEKLAKRYIISTTRKYMTVVRPMMLDDGMFVGYCQTDNKVYLITASAFEQSTEAEILALESGEALSRFAWLNNTLVCYTDQRVILLQYEQEDNSFVLLSPLNNASLPAPRIAVGEDTEGEDDYILVASEWNPEGDVYGLTQEKLDIILTDFLTKYAEKRKDGLDCGFANIMIAYKLFDGNYTLHQGPFPINLFYTPPRIVHDGGTYPDANRRMEMYINKIKLFYFFPEEVRDDLQAWFDMGIIQSLSVFMTDLINPYNVFEPLLEKWSNGTGGYYPPADYTQVDLLPEAINYYHVGDIQISDIVNSPTDEPGRYLLPLGDGKLTSIQSNEAMPVDNFSYHQLLPGADYRYNSRLHLGDIKTIPGKIPWPFYEWFNSASAAPELDGAFYPRNDQMLIDYTTSHIASTSTQGIFDNTDYSLMVAATLVVDGRKCVSIKTVDTASLRHWGDLGIRALVSYPDIRATKLTVLIGYTGDENSPRVLAEYDLVKHPFHNYAYYKNPASWYKPSWITLPTDNTAYNLLPQWNNTLPDFFEEPNRVQVSEVNNLFYFPAKQSYRIGNPDYTVRAMMVAQEPMTEMQFGQFPLYVFTAGGVFALEYAGGGDVLYSRITQFLTDIIAEGVTPLALSGGAIVYQEENAIKVLVGRESKDISRPVVAESENPLIGETNFITLLNDETIARMIDKVDSHEMGRNIVNFMRNARIAYDSRTKEILFSTTYPQVYAGENNYTLVYQLTSGSWYKRTDVYDGFLLDITGHLGMVRSQQGLLYVIQLFDLDNEVQVLDGEESELQHPWVVAQTRPMHLDSIAHKRIFDLIARFKARNIVASLPDVITRGLFGYLYDYFSLLTINRDAIDYGYGALYNWYAATDESNICAVGWEVPIMSEFQTLATYLGGNSIAGGLLKDTDLLYWLTPNTNATNAYNFNKRGSGTRSSTEFVSINSVGNLWINHETSTSNAIFIRFDYNNAVALETQQKKYFGCSVRPFRLATSSELLLSDGDSCAPYIGNDGKIYPTVKIGTQVWVAQNLAETKFRNGDTIPFAGANGINFTNAEWAALTTAGMCYYNNDESYGYTGGEITSIDQKVAPAGFHILTKSEAEQIVEVLGGNSLAGNAMKEPGTAHWNTGNGGTNESDLTVLGAGFRADDAEFDGYREQGIIWLADEGDEGYAYAMQLTRDSAAVVFGQLLKGYGLSVRLAMDDPSLYVPGMTVTDRDGNVYDLVQVSGEIDGTQVNIVLTKQNWACTKYADGTDIELAQEDEEWTEEGTDGKFCNYDDAYVVDIPPVINGEVSSWFSHNRRMGVVGFVDPRNLATTVQLEYGPDTDYGTTIDLDSFDPGVTEAEARSYIIPRLTPGTYHWRLVATNSAGTTYGEDQEFTIYPGTNRDLTDYVLDTFTGTTYFIDPDAATNGDGLTAETPMNAYPATMGGSNIYQQKAGTTATFSGNFSTINGPCKITHYGTGTRPEIICTQVNSDDLFRFLRTDYKMLIQNVVLSKADTTGIVVYIVNAPGTTLYNCDISGGFVPVYTQAGGAGLNEVWSGVKVLYCDIHRAGNDGMYFRYTTDVEVGHCYIYDINRDYFTNPDQAVSSGDCIQVASGGNASVNVHHCTLDHSTTGNKFNFIIYSNNSSFEFKHNHVIGSRDFQGHPVSGIYIHPNTFLGIVHGNIFENHNIGIFNQSINLIATNNLFVNQNKCITTLQNYQCKAYNNVFYGYVYNALERLTGASLTAKNNVFKSLAGYAFSLSGSGTQVIDYNHFDGIGAAPAGTNYTAGDSKFTDVADMDFYPDADAGSPLINSGVNVDLSHDFDGVSVSVPPSKGLYE